MDEDKKYTDTDGLNTEYPDNNEQDNAGFADDISSADQETESGGSAFSEDPVMDDETDGTVFPENAGSEDAPSGDEVIGDMSFEGDLSDQTVPPQDRGLTDRRRSIRESF